MPTVSIVRDQLFDRLGKVYTEDEFQLLCFEFGIELDDVVTEADEESKEDVVVYKIDVPANRYDILCIEGLARALKVFLGQIQPPVFKVLKPASPYTITVKKETAQIRPYIVSAVLRNIRFTPENYKSFIDLQDKLHQNICRRRTLVAIGTHDLDTIEGPFTYEALPPQDIRFVPLSQSKEYDAASLMEFYRTDPSVKHIKPYVDIIADSPVYPVIYDKNRTLLSLPPIINGEHSKITLKTRNVFIESTATDLTKANIVLNTIVAMFSEYCEEPFTVEPVNVTYETEEPAYTTPNMSSRTAAASLKEIKNVLGVELTPSQVCEFCNRMQLTAKYDEAKDAVEVQVPPTRSDVLHECDIVEDVAIAFGYNNIPRRLPPTLSSGAEQPVNKLSDLLRGEIASAGYTECLTMALLAREENYGKMRKPEDGLAVVLANPKTEEFQIARTSLLPGLLKSLEQNKDASVKDGVKIFEISDVVLQTKESDVGAVNERRFAAAYMGLTAGFEVVHGVIDRLMELLSVKKAGQQDESDAMFGPGKVLGNAWGEWWLTEGEDPTYLPGRCAQLFVKKEGESEARKVGTFGVLHPEVLAAFELVYPASVLEVNLEPFV